MNGTVYQLTLRRWSEALRHPGLYFSFAAAVSIATAGGPFGTFDSLSLAQRLGFWFLALLTCWTIGLLAIVPLRLYLQKLGAPKFFAFLTATCLASAIICPIFITLLTAVKDRQVDNMTQFEHLLLTVPVVVIVSLLVLHASGESTELLNRADQHSKKTRTDKMRISDDDETNNCVILQKLPPEKRGAIFAMLAQDHYVEVITNRGKELVLARLTDATALCGDQDGLRIHRSTWVSRKGIETVEKQGRKMRVVLRNGLRLPVARTMEGELVKFLGDSDSGISGPGTVSLSNGSMPSTP